MLTSSCCQSVLYHSKNEAGNFCYFCWVAVFVVSWEYNCFPRLKTFYWWYFNTINHWCLSTTLCKKIYFRVALPRFKDFWVVARLACCLSLWAEVSLYLIINPFFPNASFLYTLKTFQGVEKGYIGNKLVKLNLYIALEAIIILVGIQFKFYELRILLIIFRKVSFEGFGNLNLNICILPQLKQHFDGTIV